MTPRERIRRRLAWYARMVELAESMPEEKLAELEEWERQNVGEHLVTSDWPGWRELGLRPFDEEEAES